MLNDDSKQPTEHPLFKFLGARSEAEAALEQINREHAEFPQAVADAAGRGDLEALRRLLDGFLRRPFNALYQQARLVFFDAARLQYQLGMSAASGKGEEESAAIRRDLAALAPKVQDLRAQYDAHLAELNAWESGLREQIAVIPTLFLQIERVLAETAEPE